MTRQSPIRFFVLIIIAAITLVLPCAKIWHSISSTSTHILYYNNNELVLENNPTESWLHFLYNNKLGVLVKTILVKPWISHLLGLYYDSWLSKYSITSFIKTYSIDMTSFVVPAGGYKSFNDFFIRSLRPEARSIDTRNDIIASPADSKLMIIQNVDQSTQFAIKNRLFDLATFLKDTHLAQSFYGATMCIFRLAPYDYHRFHFPLDCIPSPVRIINGLYESVNPLVFRAGVQPLLENERHLTLLATKNFGTVAMIAVGALFVGKIVETFTPNRLYKKGDEAGFFAFGGSTIVLLFKKGSIQPINQYKNHSLQGYESAILVGQAINQ